MVSKETYYWAKENYYGVKRDLLWCQKRPTIGAKETYCVWTFERVVGSTVSGAFAS